MLQVSPRQPGQILLGHTKRRGHTKQQLPSAVPAEVPEDLPRLLQSVLCSLLAEIHAQVCEPPPRLSLPGEKNTISSGKYSPDSFLTPSGAGIPTLCKVKVTSAAPSKDKALVSWKYRAANCLRLAFPKAWHRRRWTLPVKPSSRSPDSIVDVIFPS